MYLINDPNFTMCNNNIGTMVHALAECPCYSKTFEDKRGNQTFIGNQIKYMYMNALQAIPSGTEEKNTVTVLNQGGQVSFHDTIQLLMV